MRRREFTAGLLSSVAIGRAWAQERRIPRIALFHPAIPITSLTEAGGGTAWRAFFSELRRLGYVEGQSVSIQRYSAEGHHERYADIAREIVRSKPDLIVTGTNPVVLAFKAITSNVPVVAFMIDPLKAGLVESLARPGGNLTGITLDAGIEIWGKRLELLKEAVPSLERTAFLGMREGWEGSFGKSMRDIAGNLGTSLISVLPTAARPRRSSVSCGDGPATAGRGADYR
jgi:putative ABC transport system substrate-binding protein